MCRGMASRARVASGIGTAAEELARDYDDVAADFAAFVASHSKVPAKSALASKDWTREDLRAVVSAIGGLPDNG